MAEIEFYNGVIVRTLTTRTEKKGDYWHLKITSYLESSKGVKNITVRVYASINLEGGQRQRVQKIVPLTTRDDGTAEAVMEMVISEVYENIMVFDTIVT